ncbi:MAG: rod shape-determining protein MreD [Firmicutes bacterium]|nr:rod shape-determining protein MreD [Bacillota bacterium]
MRKIVFLATLIVAGLIIQSGVFPLFSVNGIKPDLLLLLVIAFAVQRGGETGAVLGLVTGLIQDIVFGHVLGLFAGSKMVTGALAGLIGRRFFGENPLVLAALALLATVVHSISLLLLAGLSGILEPEGPRLLMEIVLPEALTNAVLMLPIYYYVRRIVRQGNIFLPSAGEGRFPG